MVYERDVVLDRGFNYFAETHDPQTEPLLVVSSHAIFSLEYIGMYILAKLPRMEEQHTARQKVCKWDEDTNEGLGAKITQKNYKGFTSTNYVSLIN